jgi:hypothetical protein
MTIRPENSTSPRSTHPETRHRTAKNNRCLSPTVSATADRCCFTYSRRRAETRFGARGGGPEAGRGQPEDTGDWKSAAGRGEGEGDEAWRGRWRGGRGEYVPSPAGPGRRSQQATSGLGRLLVCEGYVRGGREAIRVDPPNHAFKKRENSLYDTSSKI